MSLKQLQDGDMLLPFKLNSSAGKVITNDDLLGRKTILFIYSKDGTASCTKEAQNFSNVKQKFLNLNAEIYGISKDSITLHKKFINKFNLKIDLLSDETAEFITSIGSWVEKSMYGKKYMGTERTTILISEKGRILQIWRKVRVPGHVEEVLSFVENN